MLLLQINLEIRNITSNLSNKSHKCRNIKYQNNRKEFVKVLENAARSLTIKTLLLFPQN